MLSRREFVTALTAAPLAAGAPGRKPVVAAHPWVYAATQPKYDIYPILEGIFADMSYAGIEAIELMHTALRPKDAVERIGGLSRKNKLPVLGTSFEGKMWDKASHRAVLDDAGTVVERLTKLGGRTFGVSVGDAGRRKTPEELDAQAALLRKLINLCEDHRVVLNLHNHIYEVANDEYDLKGTLVRIPDARLGPDLDWLKGADIDPVDFIHRYAPRIVYCHLRDRKADGVWAEAIGEGATDFTAIGRALREAGFEGDVAIELAHPAGFRPTRPLRESLKISREYVKKTMGW